MKTFELREQGSEDLRTRLGEIKEEFFNLRFQNATGQLENYKQLGRAKRDIARIETILRERELEGDETPEVRAEQSVEESARRARRKWGRRSKEEPSATSDETEGEEEEAADE